MTLLSTLRVLSRVATPVKTSLRHGGHGRRIRIERGDYMWSHFKDRFHFYILLGVIPLTLISAYANIFIGDAELTEIPEGYTPHYWEYYKNPVSRFIGRYILYDKAGDYETLASKMSEESESIILKRIERELRDMMIKNGDNKSWYYKPYHIEDNRFQNEYYNIETFRYLGLKDRGDKSD